MFMARSLSLIGTFVRWGRGEGGRVAVEQKLQSGAVAAWTGIAGTAR